jgi:hypothetical protein
LNAESTADEVADESNASPPKKDGRDGGGGTGSGS